MADSAVAVTAGAGTNIDTRTESSNGNHRAVVVLGDPTANTGVAPVDGTSGLKVDLGADNDITGTVTANLSATDNAVLDSIQAATEATQAAVEGTVAISGSVFASLDNETTKVIGVTRTAAGDGTLIGSGGTGNPLSVQIAGANGALTVDLGANNDVSLNAGTNAIGKLAANSGVDIGDVDVTSLPALAAGTAAIGKVLPPDVDITTHTNYIKKYYTSAGAATDGIIWSPSAGKRWHVVSMYLQTSAAATITLEDDKSGGDEVVWKGEFAANQGMTINFSELYPLASGEDAADLMVTTSAGNIYITVTGYEI